jgi:acyl-coenzyme A thioesterase PaaI-like protein
MSFSVLPRRDANPDIEGVRDAGPTTMALPESKLAQPLLDELGVTVRDAVTGEVDVPVRDWSRNSMGAMQGGAVATVADIAAEAALRAAAGAPLVVTDLQLSYLGFGRVGPVRSRVEVLASDAARGRAHVELFDTGAENRRMASVRVGAALEPA